MRRPRCARLALPLLIAMRVHLAYARCASLLMLQAAMARPVSTADVEAEMSVRGGLLPLMHLFPSQQSHPGNSIPWQPEDQKLQQWLATSAAYAAAAGELRHAHDT